MMGREGLKGGQEGGAALVGGAADGVEVWDGLPLVAGAFFGFGILRFGFSMGVPLG